MPRGFEGPAHVAVSLSGRQPRLRPSGPHAPEGWTGGQSELPREVCRLIEPAFAASRRMKGHGHHGCCTSQDVGASFEHER